MGKRGRKKSRETLDKEAFKEWKDTTNEAFDETELAGRRLHHSPRHDPEERIRLSGNLKTYCFSSLGLVTLVLEPN